MLWIDLQQNLQSECRRLRSQVSDLEQRNVALNLLLTQSLRDCLLDAKSGGAPPVPSSAPPGKDTTSFQKSASCDANIASEFKTTKNSTT